MEAPAVSRIRERAARGGRNPRWPPNLLRSRARDRGGGRGGGAGVGTPCGAPHSASGGAHSHEPPSLARVWL